MYIQVFHERQPNHEDSLAPSTDSDDKNEKLWKGTDVNHASPPYIRFRCPERSGYSIPIWIVPPYAHSDAQRPPLLQHKYLPDLASQHYHTLPVTGTHYTTSSAFPEPILEDFESGLRTGPNSCLNQADSCEMDCDGSARCVPTTQPALEQVDMMEIPARAGRSLCTLLELKFQYQFPKGQRNARITGCLVPLAIGCSFKAGASLCQRYH
ncbi:hypothetical protein V8E53_004474 [Lactarius tabidus]